MSTGRFGGRLSENAGTRDLGPPQPPKKSGLKKRVESPVGMGPDGELVVVEQPPGGGGTARTEKTQPR